MSRYTKYIKPYLFYFIFGPLMMITEVFGEIWIPRLMSFIINNGVANHDVGYILKVGGVMLAACVLMVIGGILGCYFGAKAAVNFTTDLRSDLFKKVQAFSFADVDVFSTGSLVTRLTNDLQQIQMMVLMSLRMALRSPGMMIGGIIMALGINRGLAGVLLVVIPLLCICVFLIMKTAYPLFTKMQTALDNLNNGIKETLTNVRVVKSFVREDFEHDKFTVLNDELRDKTIRALSIVIMNMPVMNIFMNITSCAVVWFGGNQIIAGGMQVGDLTAFITYVTQILMSLMMVSMVILTTARSMASFKRTNEILDLEPDLTDDNARFKDKKVTKGAIEFRNVSFSYASARAERVNANASAARGYGDLEGQGACLKGTALSGDIDRVPLVSAGSADATDVLQNISISIKPGETVGILGATGCGKTSMVQLIQRLYDVTEGQVLVDGVDVRDYSLKNLRDGVAMVLQYNMLFSGTVEENLRWGDEDASDEEIRRFASYAQVDGFVNEFKEGYDHMIEQGGTNVSGGQKQRLCIARALLKKPKILILDDSTSAVDTATEKKINEAFASELKDTTKLIIAQRVNSVKDADRIIVMDDGRIVDIGSHAELISRCDEYRAIYYSQIDKEREETA